MVIFMSLFFGLIWFCCVVVFAVAAVAVAVAVVDLLDAVFSMAYCCFPYIYF